MLNRSDYFSHTIGSIIELRRLEKEEEKRAREKIRQKLEEDKVSAPHL
jgi:hypothetical protein